MKKITLSLIFLFAFITKNNAQVFQVTNCGGSTASNTYGPMNSVAAANATNITATIYPASQLTSISGQVLNVIYFNRLTATGSISGTPNFKIYLKETTATDFGSASIIWASQIAGATLVYNSNPATVTGTNAGWKSFPLSTNFTYTGTQNLAVYMEYSNSSASTTIGWEYEYTAPCINTTNSNTTKYSNNTSGVIATTTTSTNYRRPQIGFDFLVACERPTALTSSSVTTTSATISWTAPTAAPANGYEYYYSTSPIAPLNLTVPSGTTAAGVLTANLTSLSPVLDYYAWVRSVCSPTVKSIWTNVNTFRTLCVAVTSLPWTENFDALTPGTNIFPACWSYTNTLSTWSISTTPTAYSGANSLRRTWSTDGWTFTPLVTLNANDSYDFSYFVRTNDNVVGYDITVGTGTAQTIAAMTTTLSSITGYQSPNWVKVTYTFIPTVSGDYSFGIHVTAPNAPNGINFDDFKLGRTPTCLSPVGLTSTTVTTSSASISWTSITPTPLGYEYLISTSNITPSVAGTATTNTSVNLTALSPSTTYYFWIRTNCGAGIFSTWNSYLFMTPCLPVTSLPWTENFDALTPGTNIFPACWSYTNTLSTWSISTTPTAYSGANSLRRTWSTDGWTFTPLVTLNANDSYDFSYFVRTNDNVVGYDITVGTGTAQTIAAMTTTLSSITGYQSPNWVKVTYTFIPTVSGDYSFGIHVTAPNAPNGINFDDFKLGRTPTCLSPVGLTSTTVTTSSASISWTSITPTPLGYEYLISTSNITPSVAGTATTNTSVNLTALSPSTTYYFWIRTNCGAGIFSTWNSYLFMTPCLPVTSLPWTENFDALTPGTNIFPACWSYTNTLSTWSISTTPTAYSGANSLRRTWSTDGWTFTPLVTLNANDSYDFSYFVRTNDNVVGYDITVGTGTAQTIAAMTTTLSSITGYQSPNWVKVTYTFIPTVSGDYSFGIHVTAPNAPNGINFDDFKLELTPTCTSPSGLSTSAITTTTATISWTAVVVSPAVGYEYYYSTSPTAPTNAIAASGLTGYRITTANLTGLNSNTTYYFWVRSVCSQTDKSAWSVFGNFKTSCVYITSFPYNEAFTTFIPNCWSTSDTGNVVTGPLGTANGIWVADDFLNAPGTNSGAIKVNLYGINRIGWMISPFINMSAGGYQVSFNYGVTTWNTTTASTMGSDDFVQLLSSQDGGSNWAVVTTFNAASNVNNTNNTFTQTLPSYTSANTLFAFYATDGTVNDTPDYDFFIDNFIIGSTLAVNSFDSTNFYAYPNPVKDIFNLSYDKEISSVEIYNLLGQLVISKILSAKQIQVDMSNLTTGNYIVKIKADNQEKTIKIIKQ